MDPSGKIQMLQFFARRLIELPAPDLTISELQEVLQWQLVPKSASGIYEYARSASMFLNCLDEVDWKCLDSKTKKLISSALKKIWAHPTGDSRYSELFTNLAGIITAHLAVSYTSNSWAQAILYLIYLVIETKAFIGVHDARGQEDLSRANTQLQQFVSSTLQAMRENLIVEFAAPILGLLWDLVQHHPWWSLGAVVLTPFTLAIAADPQVKEWWYNLRLLSYFYLLALSGRIGMGAEQAVGWIFQVFRILPWMILAEFGIDLVMEMLVRLALGQPAYEKVGRFNYPPNFLHQQEIRLLRIDRHTPLMGLKAELFAVDDTLLGTTDYDAVSYVWGSGERDRIIVLNGRPFLVTTNVYNVIYRSSSYRGERVVWIDTICINQDDVEEKKSQIQRMRNIYDQATTVQIFLPDSPSARLAVPFMNRLLMYYGSSKRDFAGIMSGMQRRKNMDKYLRLQIDALLELLANSWFERTWVVQEFVVARQVMVHYGKQSFDWEKLKLLAEIIQDEEVPEAAQCLMSGGERPGSQLKTFIKRPVLLDRWKTKILLQRQVKLSQVLPSFLGCKAGRWQDKVIALIGFTDSAEKLSKLIDYELPKDSILLTLAHHLLEQGELLETLPFAGLSALPTYPTNLPTWVVDWTVTRRLDPIAPVDTITTDTYLPYNSSFQGIVRVDRKLDREIIVAGVILDKVWEISGADLDSMPDAGTIRSNPGVLNRVLHYFHTATDLARRLVSDPYNPIKSKNTNIPLDEAISRTMIGDATKKSRPAAEAYSDIVSRLIDHGLFIVDAIENRGFTWDDIHPLPWGCGAYKNERWREQEVRKLMQQIENVRWLCGGDARRKFCVTEKCFIGMVPTITRPGDVVCLIFGSAVPMIMRKCSSGDSYQLVGEAYVHGIMDGEGVGTDFIAQDFHIV
jgi:hypothetical protein